MKRRSLVAVLIAALVLTLTGCLRYNSIYYIQSDGTVSGQIYTALKEGYQTDSDPYKGTGAGEIAAAFPGATIADVTSAPWYGYMVSFSNAPLSSFAAVPSAAWGVQITKTGNVYKVVGYNTDSTTAETRNAITSEGGYSFLQIGFPGALKDGGNASSSGTASGSGWAEWNLITMTGTPHAEGYGGLIFIDPGLYHFDPIPISPGPIATPAATPAPKPKPVVTVVVTPSAKPSASPSASKSAAPSPTLTTIAAPSSGDSGGGVPPWVWIALAALVVALAGVGGFLLSQRGRGAGDAAAAAGGSDAEVPPTAVLPTAVLPTAAPPTAAPPTAALPTAVPPAPGDVADTQVLKAVDPTPPVTPNELPPDVV